MVARKRRQHQVKTLVVLPDLPDIDRGILRGIPDLFAKRRQFRLAEGGKRAAQRLLLQHHAEIGDLVAVFQRQLDHHISETRNADQNPLTAEADQGLPDRRLADAELFHEPPLV